MGIMFCPRPLPPLPFNLSYDQLGWVLLGGFSLSTLTLILVLDLFWARRLSLPTRLFTWSFGLGFGVGLADLVPAMQESIRWQRMPGLFGIPYNIPDQALWLVFAPPLVLVATFLWQFLVMKMAPRQAALVHAGLCLIIFEYSVIVTTGRFWGHPNWTSIGLLCLVFPWVNHVASLPFKRRAKSPMEW